MLIGRASSLTICYWVRDQSPRGEAYSPKAGQLLHWLWAGGRGFHDRLPEVGRTDGAAFLRNHTTIEPIGTALICVTPPIAAQPSFLTLLTHSSPFHFSSPRAFPPLLERARAEARRWCSVFDKPRFCFLSLDHVHPWMLPHPSPGPFPVRARARISPSVRNAQALLRHLPARYRNHNSQAVPPEHGGSWFQRRRTQACSSI